jgi:hypothetical protein
MKQRKPVKLKNRYNNEYLLCNDVKDVVTQNSYTFYKVYTESNPNRVFLVNKEAFVIEKD